MLEEDIVSIYKRRFEYPVSKAFDTVYEKALSDNAGEALLNASEKFKHFYDSHVKIGSRVKSLFQTTPTTIPGVIGLTSVTLACFMTWTPIWYDYINSSEKKACISIQDENAFYTCSSKIESLERKNIFDAELMFASFGLMLAGTYSIYSSLSQKKQ